MVDFKCNSLSLVGAWDTNTKTIGGGGGGRGRRGEAIDLNAVECGYYSRLDEG